MTGHLEHVAGTAARPHPATGGRLPGVRSASDASRGQEETLLINAYYITPVPAKV